MSKCKNCFSLHCVKNGIVRLKQRYLCKECGYNFVTGSVLPSERHIIGKAHTHTIERDNSNTRHHLGRFTRRTKIVSKSKDMVDTTLRPWVALTSPQFFEKYQDLALSIFK